MSKRHRLEALRKRIRILRARIATDQDELAGLEQKATFLMASISVEAMPDGQREWLIGLSSPVNSEPRKPVVRE